MKILVWLSLLILFVLYHLRFEGFENSLWTSLEKKEYIGNDITGSPFASTSLEDCKQHCVKNHSCFGIVRDVDDNSSGNCWIKTKMDTGKDDKNRWAYKINRTKPT